MADDDARDPIEYLRRTADEQRVVMLATLGGGGGVPHAIDARPLTIIEVDDDGGCWFLVDQAADWIEQVASGGPANLSGGDPGDGSWFSASGDARLVRESGRVHELWTPAAQAWFDGPDDPAVAALEVRVHTLAWWESSDSRIVRVWEMAKAALGGSPDDVGDHGVERL